MSEKVAVILLTAHLESQLSFAIFVSQQSMDLAVEQQSVFASASAGDAVITTIISKVRIFLKFDFMKVE